ncbi:hypothetical protein M8J77_000789 [Diaphorina citri]|nr:hypothetical protein M8J77_000789 [Diaphorina citri]
MALSQVQHSNTDIINHLFWDSIDKILKFMDKNAKCWEDADVNHDDPMMIEDSLLQIKSRYGNYIMLWISLLFDLFVVFFFFFFFFFFFVFDNYYQTLRRKRIGVKYREDSIIRVGDSRIE